MKKYYKDNNEKKVFIKEMFNEISPSYNLLNRILSLGIDIYWRNKFINKLAITNGNNILDVATGTGDIVKNIVRRNNVKITGIDISDKMIEIAKESIKDIKSKISWDVGDAENLPYEDESFDLITISYGFRNLTDFNRALLEFNRVLKPTGSLAILEFSQPNNLIIGSLFNTYFHYILPTIASLVSSNYAYKYLPESVENLISREEICYEIESAGFSNVSYEDISFGISTIFLGKKDYDK